MNVARRALTCFFILLLALGCRPQPGGPFEIEVLSAPPPCSWAFTSGESGDDEQTFFFFSFAEGSIEGDHIYSGPRDDILAVWADGMLIESDEGVEWMDIDPSTHELASDPGVDLTSWETPIGVDHTERIIYALAHEVPPTRKLEAHYLDGREPEHVNQFTSDEIEPLDPLPCNGWPVLYVDRPGQAGAITIEKTPTRRMRVYGRRALGGEFYDVLGIFFLADSIVVHREEDWSLMEIGGIAGVTGRTLSLGQVPGTPRPLARVDGALLVAGDAPLEGAQMLPGSRLFAYGLYTRTVDEIWDPASVGDPMHIFSLAVRGPDDYLMVLASLPEAKTLTLGRLHEGVWQVHVRIELTQPATECFLFFVEE